jgi:hypothetical protein
MGNSREQLGLIRALFPELATSVDAAYARYAGGGADGGHGGEPGGERDDADFDAWLDAETAELREGALAGVAFAAVNDAGSRFRFERAFSAARVVVGNTAAGVPGLHLPEPETFAAAGVDFEKLGAALAADVTLLPVPTPFGLGAAAWQSLFSAQDQAPSLVIASEAAEHFPILDAVPDPHLPQITDPARPGVHWTLRLVPAAASPAVIGLDFRDGPHAALPEMLMLQLMRVVQGDRPVDESSFTWLAGSFGEDRLAARHVYDVGEDTIRISCREVGNQGPHLGARPPIG